MEKMKKTARVLDTVARVVRVICICSAILAGIAGVGFLLLYLWRDTSSAASVLARGSLVLDLGDVALRLSEPLTYYNAGLPVMAALMGLSAAWMAAAALAAGILHRILAPMTEGRPFDGTVSRNLRRLAWLSLVWSVGGRLLANAVTSLEMKLTDLSRIFAPGAVTEYRVNLGLSAGDLLVPAVLFLLSYIFHYGQELQMQSDETL